MDEINKKLRELMNTRINSLHEMDPNFEDNKQQAELDYQLNMKGE